MSNAALKDCPFCGSHMEIEEYYYAMRPVETHYTVGGKHDRDCPLYDASLPTWDDPEELANSWNGRYA